jgi:predicted RNA-binding protein YlxR (DUF448 family)
VPKRRCVGCGRIAPKPALVRLALVEGPDGRVIDGTGTRGGRGAYVCRGDRRGDPARDCLTRALKRGGLERAFRRAVTMDPDFVESMF